MDSNRMIFIGLTEMKKYCGFESNQSGGGEYVNQNGFGHELFNFKEDNGCCYGYTAPYGRINIRKISNAVNSDELGQYIDDVLVVFTGSRPKAGRIIVGWYKNARVYSESVDDNRQSRYLGLINEYISYNIVCDTTNVTLVNYENRSFVVPHTRSNNGVGHGQHNIWYANQPKDMPFKLKVIDYISNYDNDFI